MQSVVKSFETLCDRLYNDKASARVVSIESLKEISLASSSKGNQRKWVELSTGRYIKEQFFYQGKYWNDWKVELLSSIIHKTMDTRVKIVEQSPVQLDCGTMAVISDNFCAEDETFISFNRIIQRKGIEYNEKLFPLEKFEFVKNTVLEECGIDITEYLIVMAVIDYILLNEDRHLNNFGVIKGSYGYREAPLFDFGLGLFEHDKKYEGKLYDTAVLRINGKPFCEDMQAILYALARSSYTEILDRVLCNVKYEDVVVYAPNDLGKVHLKEALETIEKLKEMIRGYEYDIVR